MIIFSVITQSKYSNNAGSASIDPTYDESVLVDVSVLGSFPLMASTT